MPIKELTSDFWNPFPLIEPDQSITSYIDKPFYPVTGQDLSKYKNNTIRIVTKGLDDHMLLCRGYLEGTFKVESQNLVANAQYFNIVAGVNDTFELLLTVGPDIHQETATIAPGNYNVADFQAAIQTAIGNLADGALNAEAANVTFAQQVLGVTYRLSVTTTDTLAIHLYPGLFNYLGFDKDDGKWLDYPVGDNIYRVLIRDGATVFSDTALSRIETVMHSNVCSLFTKASLWFNNVNIHSIDFPSNALMIMNCQDLCQNYVDAHKEEWLYTEPNNYLYNSTASAKVARTTGAAYVRYIIKLDRLFPFLQSYTQVVRGVEVRVELEKNNTNSEMFYSLNATPLLTLGELTMWVPLITASPKVEAMMLEDIKQRKETVIHYDNYEVYRQLNTPQSQLTWNIDNIAEIPKYVYIGFQHASQLDSVNPDLAGDNASYVSINPSIFQNLGLVRAEIRVNNNVFPKHPYKLQFNDSTNTNSQEVDRLFWEFLRVKYRELEYDNGSLIEFPSQFTDVFPFVTFNLSRAEEVFLNQTQNNTIEVFVQFDQAPPQNFYIIAVIVYEEKILLKANGKGYEWRK